MNQTNDLTQGPIVKKLLLFFLPIVAGTLLQQLYNTADAFVVSKFLGTDALASVGGSPAILSNVIIGFCVALSGGCAVLISQQFGAGRYEEVTRSVKTSFTFCLLLGVVVGGVTVWLSPQLLTLLKTTPESYEGSLIYQRIYFAGGVFLLAYNMGASILRAVGDSKFPFLCLLVTCILNIGLDVTFVVVLHWGVAGVAVATVIAEVVSAIMVTVKLLVSRGCFALRFRNVAFGFTSLRQMLAIGVPSGLQAAMFSISNLILQVAVNTLGTVVVASWAMCGKIDGLYWSTSNALGTALTTFVGQNFGKGNYDRVRQSTKKGFYVLLIMTLSLIAVILCIARPLLHILSDDIAVVDTTWTMLLFFVPAYVLWSVIEIYSGTLRGVGDTVMPAVILGVGICGVRTLWVATVFMKLKTLSAVCICYPISWFITAIAIYLYYRKKAPKFEKE